MPIDASPVPTEKVFLDRCEAEFDERTSWEVAPAVGGGLVHSFMYQPPPSEQHPSRERRLETIGEITISGVGAVFYRLLNPGSLRVSSPTLETAKAMLSGRALKRFIGQQKDLATKKRRCGNA